MSKIISVNQKIGNFKKIISIIGFSFSIFRRNKIKKTDFLKQNKSEPILHKNKSSLVKAHNSKEKKQKSNIIERVTSEVHCVDFLTADF